MTKNPMKSSHDLLRDAVAKYGITRQRVIDIFLEKTPRCTPKLAGEMFDQLVEGRGCKEILAVAILHLIQTDQGMTKLEAVNLIMPVEAAGRG